MQNVVTNFGKTGVKEMNLIPFDPLQIKTMKLARNPSSPVNIELVFHNVQLEGLSQSKVIRLKGYNENLHENIITEFMVPKLVLKGPYTINGNVLVLPIVGKGNSEMILEDTLLSLKIKTKPFEKDGKPYMDFENFKLDIKPKRAQFYLENLFNGNKELGDNMNKFINENWKEIYTELQPAISEGFALVLRQLLTNIFTKYPYESYFEQQTK